MINLLPPETKEIIVYSRKNKQLVGWVFALIVVVVVIIAMTVFGLFYIQKNENHLKSVSEITKSRITTQNLEATQKSMETLAANFKTVMELLKKQLLFSKILQKIGSILPPGAKLTGINLSNTDLAIDLSVVGENREIVKQAAQNVTDPANGLFEKADLVSISCAELTKVGELPCNAQIKAVLKADSSLYFLNSVSSGSQK